MGHRRMPMECGLRVLSQLSLVFGLLASGALSLAVSTDFWLFTTETLNVEAVILEENVTSLLKAAKQPAVDQVDVPSTVAKLHSGLWRKCMYYDKSDFDDEIPLHPICTNIPYFSDIERQDGADTTNSISRAIRKSSPVIVGSLLIMVTALALSILGNNKRDVRTLVAAILYICSALSLAVGVIFYISAVNDEVSHRKKSLTSDKDSFTYHYGWAFFFAGSSFMCAMVAAVNNISLYLRRGFDGSRDGSTADVAGGGMELMGNGGSGLLLKQRVAESDEKDFDSNSQDCEGQHHHHHPLHHLHHHVNITTPV